MTATQLELLLADEQATFRLGMDLALSVQRGDCLALYGDLGVGKSTLARALIRCVGEDGELEVPSPTFTLVQNYDLRLTIAHYDLYRIADPDELIELGLEEALQDGVALIEWPERAPEYLPPDTITIQMLEEGAGRRVHISGPQAAVRRVGRSLQIRRFLENAGYAQASRSYFTGDASTRSYELIGVGDGKKCVLMNAPERLLGPALKGGKRYAQIAHVAENIRPFAAIGKFLDGVGFTTPNIHVSNLDEGLLLLQDLGREPIVDGQGQPIIERWDTAIDCLIALHRLQIPAQIPLPGHAPYNIPLFDRDAMMIELSLFLEWYVPYRYNAKADETITSLFESGWNGMIDHLQSSDTSLVLRDFHSPNILWQASEPGVKRIGLIDFQDAMIGPATYDVASLVHDARVTIAPDLQDHLVDRYCRARSGDANFDETAFHRALAIMQAQRATKILGIFVRLKIRDGKSGYIRYLEHIETYLKRALRHSVLEPLHECYTKAGIL